MLEKLYLLKSVQWDVMDKIKTFKYIDVQYAVSVSLLPVGFIQFYFVGEIHFLYFRADMAWLTHHSLIDPKRWSGMNV